MHVWAQVVLAVLVVVAFVASGVFVVRKNDEMEAAACFIIGSMFIVCLAVSPLWNPSGLPFHDIDPGTYKVGFVYLSGENVNVGIEWKFNEKSQEVLYYYQFKKDAFEGTLNANAKNLIVVQSGTFKKLRLE